MNTATITADLFDSLTKGQTVSLSFSSCMGGAQEVSVVVGRRSFSKKWGVTTLSLDVPGVKPSSLCRLRLYKRACGDVSVAMGDMAVFLTSFNVG